MPDSHRPGPAQLIIASRQSRLAMWQAEYVRSKILARYPQCDIRILGMTTEGDRRLDVSLAKLGGKGMFTKELETALLEGRADFAVHSLKDVPMRMAAPFILSAVLKREDPHDAFVSEHYAALADLPDGARVGTSSLRRAAQIHFHYPRLTIIPLRGNLQTRLTKLDQGVCDAIILAAAGLKRLGLTERIRMLLDLDDYPPAPGQGALGIESLSDRIGLQAWLTPISNQPTLIEVTAERRVSEALGGNCQMPLAAYCRPILTGGLRLHAQVFSVDGKQRLAACLDSVGNGVDEARLLGDQVAAQLLQAGAAELLNPVSA